MSNELEPYEPGSYWRSRVRPYLGIDDLGIVTSPEAPIFVKRFTHWLEARTLRRILPYLPSEGRLLDVGCGYGRWFELYQSKNMRVVGLDIVPELVERGQQLHPEAVFVVGDARQLPFDSAEFDAIITVTVAQWVPLDQQRTLFHEFSRCLRKNGIVIMLESIRGKTDGIVFPRCPESWITLAREAGLALVDWKGSHFVPLDRLLDRVRIGLGTLYRHYSSVPKTTPVIRQHRIFSWGFYTLKLFSITLSMALEPLLEKILPRQWATHGLFIFRKELQS